jgi:hypothetical protein
LFMPVSLLFPAQADAWLWLNSSKRESRGLAELRRIPL